jgi:hypothetical protein
MLRAYVGPNADWYLAKWRESDAAGGKNIFGVAAFFVSAFWLIYRKDFQLGFGILGGFLLLNILVVLGGAGGLQPLVGLIGLGAAIFVGFTGIKRYRQQAEQAIARASSMQPDPNARFHILQQEGGTNMGAVLGALGGWFVIMMGISILAT